MKGNPRVMVGYERFQELLRKEKSLEELREHRQNLEIATEQLEVFLNYIMDDSTIYKKAQTFNKTSDVIRIRETEDNDFKIELLENDQH